MSCSRYHTVICWLKASEFPQTGGKNKHYFDMDGIYLMHAIFFVLSSSTEATGGRDEEPGTQSECYLGNAAPTATD